MPKEAYRPLDLIFGSLSFFRDISEKYPLCDGCEHITSFPLCDWGVYNEIIRDKYCLSCPNYKKRRTDHAGA